MNRLYFIFLLLGTLASKAQNTFISCGAIWSTQNLDVTTYRDGTAIPQVTSFSTLQTLQTGAWMYYNNTPGSHKLYNWYAVAGIYDALSLNNPALRKQIAPTGWSVPTDSDWNKLTKCLDANADTTCLNCDASSSAGQSLKSIGLITSYAGSCDFGGCANENIWQNYWTSSSYDGTYALARYINKDQSSLQRYIQYAEKYHGFSVALIRDFNVPTITSFSPKSAKPGDEVTIVGSGINSVAANNIVFFGATRAIVK